MADISKIQLPHLEELNIKDVTARDAIENISLAHTYDSTTKTVSITVGSLTNADSTEY